MRVNYILIMNEKEYKNINYELSYKINGRNCQRCNKYLNGIGDGMGHRISQSRVNKKKYGYEVIHHFYNLSPACSKHNDSYNINNKPYTINRLLELIKNADKFYTAKEIDKFLEA